MRLKETRLGYAWSWHNDVHEMTRRGHIQGLLGQERVKVREATHWTFWLGTGGATGMPESIMILNFVLHWQRRSLT